MRRAAKVDDNHGAIVATIRAAGFSVHDTSAIGRGFPDLVCSFGGRTFLAEIKDGSKSPSRRRLTVAQETFRNGWQSHIEILETVAQAQLWCIGVTKGFVLNQ